jgi:hypothetical protein
MTAVAILKNDRLETLLKRYFRGRLRLLRIGQTAGRQDDYGKKPTTAMNDR